jgi:hypothetical protein
MIISTTKCEEFGHPEFVVEADESSVPDIYIREMVETIEHMVASGSVFRPGEVPERLKGKLAWQGPDDSLSQ